MNKVHLKIETTKKKKINSTKTQMNKISSKLGKQKLKRGEEITISVNLNKFKKAQMKLKI